MLLSGTGLSPWSLVSDPAKYAAIVSHHVNCAPDLPYSQLMKCLRDRTLDELLSTQIHQPDYSYAFGPSVDGVVIGKFNIVKLFTKNRILQQTTTLNSYQMPSNEQKNED